MCAVAIDWSRPSWTDCWLPFLEHRPLSYNKSIASALAVAELLLGEDVCRCSALVLFGCFVWLGSMSTYTGLGCWWRGFRSRPVLRSPRMVTGSCPCTN